MNIEDLVINVESILSKESSDIVVELSDLSETTYNLLKDRFDFEQGYHVKGIINILRIGSDNKTYALQISRRKEDA